MEWFSFFFVIWFDLRDDCDPLLCFYLTHFCFIQLLFCAIYYVAELINNKKKTAKKTRIQPLNDFLFPFGGSTSKTKLLSTIHMTYYHIYANAMCYSDQNGTYKTIRTRPVRLNKHRRTYFFSFEPIFQLDSPSHSFPSFNMAKQYANSWLI